MRVYRFLMRPHIPLAKLSGRLLVDFSTAILPPRLDVPTEALDELSQLRRDIESVRQSNRVLHQITLLTRSKYAELQDKIDRLNVRATAIRAAIAYWESTLENAPPPVSRATTSRRRVCVPPRRRGEPARSSFSQVHFAKTPPPYRPDKRRASADATAVAQAPPVAPTHDEQVTRRPGPPEDPHPRPA